MKSHGKVYEMLMQASCGNPVTPEVVMFLGNNISCSYTHCLTQYKLISKLSRKTLHVDSQQSTCTRLLTSMEHTYTALISNTAYIHQGYFYQISKRGHLRFWTFFGKFWTFKKIVDLQYAAGFRGPGILIKRSTIADLSVYAAWLRGPDISQNIPKKV